MNELILNIQHQLADLGAPAWLQQPAPGSPLSAALAVLLVVIRMLFKRTAASAAGTGPRPTAARVAASSVR